MSVIFTPRARSSRWKALWPLALLLAVSIIGGIWLWRAWPQVLMQSAVWQRSLNLELSRLRFDFTHFEAMTPDELGRVEDMVNAGDLAPRASQPDSHDRREPP